MSRKSSNLIDYGIEEEIDPKHKFNSLLSVTVSTIMCIAAKCPLPKSNIDTTKLFLSTIKDDNGNTPRNVKGFLSLLNEYTGPYESDCGGEKRFEKPPAEKLEKDDNSLDQVSFLKESTTTMLGKELAPCPEGQTLTKKSTKTIVKKVERDPHKKLSKHIGSKITPSKSVISSKN